MTIINCSSPSPTQTSSMTVLDTVFQPVIGTLGILGNLTACVLLTSTKRMSTFHQSLLTLTVVDILLAITILVDLQRFEINLENQIYIMMMPYVWNPLKNMLLIFQTFLIMSISKERYLAVSNPIKNFTSCNKDSFKTHFLTYILPAFTLAFVFNIPKFFETKLIKIERINEKTNNIEELYDWEITNLRLSPEYIFYYVHCARLLVTGLVPFLFLLASNMIIVRRICQPFLYTEEEDVRKAMRKQKNRYVLFRSRSHISSGSYLCY